jgi:glycosyltransferase involved in cell wall biosynthesis
MNILHVVRGLKNSSGTTHIVGPLAEEQARQGENVSVWFVEQGHDPPVTPDPALVDVRRFPLSIWLPGANHPGISFPFAAELGRRIRGFDFVHIHAIWNFPTWWTMRTAVKAGVPFMVAPQGSLEPWALGRRSRWKRTLYARLTEIPLMNRAAIMQALTANEAEQIRAAGVLAPSTVVPNGVSLALFDRKVRPLAQQLGLPPGTRTLLSLSRLDPKKGIDILMRGFAQVGGANENVVLVVAGTDAGSGYEAQLRDLAKSAGIAARTVFIGEVNGSVKVEALLGADAFALISHSEGLPVACIEAMAAGLPVIVTANCNIPEIEQRRAGIIAKGDPDDVAAALHTVFGNGDAAREMGRNALALVLEKFTWEKIASQLLELYRQAVSRR